jgi:hypothetical protein
VKAWKKLNNDFGSSPRLRRSIALRISMQRIAQGNLTPTVGMNLFTVTHLTRAARKKEINP